MIRLLYTLNRMDDKTDTFDGMYQGNCIIPRGCDANKSGHDIYEQEPTYWEDDVYYRITHTHKLAQSLASVTIGIPAEKLIPSVGFTAINHDQRNGVDDLVRLKNLLLNMDGKTSTYQEMYQGECSILGDGASPTTEYDPTYWEDDVFYSFSATNKLAQSCPSVTIGIPTDKLGIQVNINDVIQDQRNEADNLKRLKNILLSMSEKTTTFEDIYNGAYVIPGGCEANPSAFGQQEYDPTYWHSGVFYKFGTTNKMKKDCPSVTVGIPADSIGIAVSDYVVADYCLRKIKPYFDALNDDLYNRARPVEENGWYYLCETGGEILVRNAAYFAMHIQKDYENGSGVNVYPYVGRDLPPKLYLNILIQVQLPFRKMKKTIKMLCKDLPQAVQQFITEFDREGLKETIELSMRQSAIREWLKTSDYCAFIANGSMLPRSKGTDLPMRNGVPFKSPEGDEIEVAGVRGMGIRRGVTVITGGGYSGKSTMLDAISAGIYDLALGDGRELCITDDTAVTISAEDGRSIKNVNISPFIQGILGGDSGDFTTDRASGSTSQAANIMEAIDSGAKMLLIDEDRSATNFMIRDRMMRELIRNEPITPFTERVRELAERGVSTVLVIGGSGEYLGIADKIYMMENFAPQDVTETAKEICQKDGFKAYTAPPADWSQSRVMRAKGFDSHPNGVGSERLLVLDLGIMMIGSEDIDLRGLHDIITPRQLHALGFMLRQMMSENQSNAITNHAAVIDLEAQLDKLYRTIEEEGLDAVYSSSLTGTGRFLDLPRKQELRAVIARMRHISVEKGV